MKKFVRKELRVNAYHFCFHSDFSLAEGLHATKQRRGVEWERGALLLIRIVLLRNERDYSPGPGAQGAAQWGGTITNYVLAEPVHCSEKESSERLVSHSRYPCRT